GLNRTAKMHRHRGETRGKPDALLRRHDVELLEQLGEADIRRALIDDDAHGAIGGGRAEIDDGARKARVAHRRPGGGQLTVERGVALAAVGAARSGHETRLLQFCPEGRGNAEIRPSEAFSPHGSRKSETLRLCLSRATPPPKIESRLRDEPI